MSLQKQSEYDQLGDDQLDNDRLNNDRLDNDQLDKNRLDNDQLDNVSSENCKCTNFIYQLYLYQKIYDQFNETNDSYTRSYIHIEKRLNFFDFKATKRKLSQNFKTKTIIDTTSKSPKKNHHPTDLSPKPHQHQPPRASDSDSSTSWSIDPAIGSILDLDRRQCCQRSSIVITWWLTPGRAQK